MSPPQLLIRSMRSWTIKFIQNYYIFSGRPLRGGTAGSVGVVPVCGLRLSADTTSSRSPTCKRKTLGPRSNTLKGLL